MIRIFVLCTFLISAHIATAQEVSESKIKLNLSTGYAFLGSGDLGGFNIQQGVEFKLSDKLSFSPSLLFAYGSNGSYPKEDSTYPYLTRDHNTVVSPVVEHERMFHHGVLALEGNLHHAFYAGIDLNLNYLLLQKGKNFLSIGAGVSAAYTEQKFDVAARQGYFNYDSEDIFITLLIPAYARYIDIGVNGSLSYFYQISEKLNLGPTIKLHTYRDGDLIWSANAAIGIKL